MLVGIIPPERAEDESHALSIPRRTIAVVAEPNGQDRITEVVLRNALQDLVGDFLGSMPPLEQSMKIDKNWSAARSNNHRSMTVFVFVPCESRLKKQIAELVNFPLHVVVLLLCMP
jgi:hypothetical protein